MEERMDMVLTWVDSKDPEWLKDYNKYQRLETGNIDNRVERYRNWDNLRYWFRGVEKFAPWVHKVFFVTCGHLPDWLDTSNEKLVVVKHTDYIPQQYLPTFNSNTIEFFFHRIKGLSEHFIYFNDDAFIIDHVTPDLFFKDGTPCDLGRLSLNWFNGMFGSSIYLAVDIVNRHFRPHSMLAKDPGKWLNTAYPKASFNNLLLSRLKVFTGFFDHHLYLNLCKSTFEKVWEKCPQDLERTCSHRFRTYGDVAFWLIRYWQLAAGQFVPSNVSKYGKGFGISDGCIASITDHIEHQRTKVVLLNDTSEPMDFERNKSMIISAFEKILPDKCSFEK